MTKKPVPSIFGRAQRRRASACCDIASPLSGETQRDVKVEVDFDKQIIRMKAPGDRKWRRIGFWLLFEQLEDG